MSLKEVALQSEQTKVNAEDYLNYVKEKNSNLVKDPLDQDHDFLTADHKMVRIKEIIKQISSTNVPVLLTGESGTGKEVVANYIHKVSNRVNAPFVAVNCAAIPSSLLEGELFGYEKGAFTGAYQRHIGKFEQASGGVLLLDEVTEMDPSLQAKLLRVLQEQQIERLGSNTPIKIDTRIIATTNKNFKAIVNDGAFRQDLYYRLYVINLEIPPLRERVKDIDMLSKYFLEKFSRQFHKEDMKFAESALERMRKYLWHGNVRELQNVIQRAILMAKDNIITVDDIPINMADPSNKDWVKYLPVGKKLWDVEVQFIIETLKRHDGNRTHAAKTLGISLRTLRNKIAEFTAMGHEVPSPLNSKTA